MVITPLYKYTAQKISQMYEMSVDSRNVRIIKKTQRNDKKWQG